MKVFVQIINTNTGVSQYGMIEEPVKKGFEIANAVKHFGVDLSNINWILESDENNFKFGIVEDTSKTVSILTI